MKITITIQSDINGFPEEKEFDVLSLVNETSESFDDGVDGDIAEEVANDLAMEIKDELRNLIADYLS
tara:strand:+ start:327 stop:527 length:201 start_codon:yes stop_codon:yes gene_type:complete